MLLLPYHRHSPIIPHVLVARQCCKLIFEVHIHGPDRPVPGCSRNRREDRWEHVNAARSVLAAKGHVGVHLSRLVRYPKVDVCE